MVESAEMSAIVPSPPADAAGTPFARHCHSDLSEPEPAQFDVERADELIAGEGDERLIKRPLRRPDIDVDGRLRGDCAAFLSDPSELDRQRTAVFLAPLPRSGSPFTRP